MKKTIVKLEDVHLNYHSKNGETETLKGINIDIKENEFVSIVGPSGCGKTTILSAIAGLLPISKGQILIEGEKVVDVGKNIGYMFQKDNLFDWLNILKNTTLGIDLNKKQLSKEQYQKEIENSKNLLKKYGLGEFIYSFPHQLSGGMRQRVALLRTLALNPKVLLLDEPFSALDYQTRLKVSDDVSDIISKEQKTAILVTHDISEAISMSDRVIVLTNRPARVKTIVDVNLKQFGLPLKRRESKDFPLLFDKIWKELTDDEKQK